MPGALKRTYAVLGLLVAVSLSLTGCGRVHRVKLTAKVRAYGREYTGTVVNEYTCWKVGHFMWGASDNCTYKGDAGVVPLGSHGYAFLLLDTPEGVGATMPYDYAFGDAHVKGWNVPLELAPQLVYFKDINDPASIGQTYPQNPKASQDIVFESLTGAPTDQPVTYGQIAKYFPWWDRAITERWGSLKGRQLTYDQDFLSMVATSSFEFPERR